MLFPFAWCQPCADEALNLAYFGFLRLRQLVHSWVLPIRVTNQMVAAVMAMVIPPKNQRSEK